MTSPPQATPTSETPISSSSTQAATKSPPLTSSDKIIASTAYSHDHGGSQYRSSQNQTTQQKSNSFIHQNNSTNIVNNNNNSNSQNNSEHNYNINDTLGNHQSGLAAPDNEHAVSKTKSPSHESHFSGGSGILSETAPKRPERRQYVNKSKLIRFLVLHF